MSWAELNIPPDYAATRGLPLCAEATELEVAAVAPDDGSEVRLTPGAAAAWRTMAAAAAADGIVLWPLSGFRSVQRQTEIIRAKLARGETIAEILQWVAAPGYSEHHTGEALDIGTPGAVQLETTFEQTAAFRWLEQHAGTFGFTLSYPSGNPFGIQYEPWHWRWKATAAAAAHRLG